MATERSMANLQRNNFYRNNYRRVLVALLGLSLIAFCLAAVLTYMNFIRPQPSYYATMANGRIIEMQSLSEPTVTSNYVTQWASFAARVAYNLDFVNYQSQLNAASVYFTDGGWQAFTNAMNSAGVMNSLQTNKLILSAVVVSPPIVVDRLIINGRYTWNVQLPMLVTYTSASENRKQNLIVSMSIQRVSSLDTAQGIQINNFSVSSPM